MMSLLLSSVSASAIRAVIDQPAFIYEAFILDENMKYSTYTISNNGFTLTNTTGGSNNSRWVPTVKHVPEENKIFYWEILCLPTGPTSYNGYFGVVTEDQYLNDSYDFDSGSNPIYFGSMSYRGNGTIWADSGNQRVTGLLPYGNDDIVMFAFNPSTNQFWTGVNGVWNHNPEFNSPTWTPSTIFNGKFYPIVQGRNTDSGGTIRTIPSQFSYPVPANCTPLGQISLNYTIDVNFSSTFLALGYSNQGPSINTAKHFIVHGGYGSGPSINVAKHLIVYGGYSSGPSINVTKHFIVHGGRNSGPAILKRTTFVILET